MSLIELRVISIVYLSAFIPILIFIYQYTKNNLESYWVKIYLFSFIACAVGWEIWFSYGLAFGDSVDVRRSDALNTFIPMHLNWILNSMADAGTISIGGLLLSSKLSGIDLSKWSWSFFSILLVWCITQNLFVEVFLYFDQLSVGKTLSWAPLAPTGPWFNPVIFELNGRGINFQTQLPWLLMTPILYKAAIYLRNNQST
jgi:hypothetical protein